MRRYFQSSLKGRMISAFIITSIIPAIIITIFSYLNTSRIVRDNVQQLTSTNLQQIKSSLKVWVDSYEDILFQIYMNDDIVDLVDQLNHDDDNTLVSSQLRRRIRGMFYTKEYIKAITIISEEGQAVFYDLLTGSTTQSSWMDSVGMNQDELYRQVAGDNNTHIIPTKNVGVYAAEDYYLFHLGHRLIDYQNVNKQLGIVIISVDEGMLQTICNDNENKNSFNFMVDKNGYIISHHNKSYLGKQIIRWTDDAEVRKKEYLEFVQNERILQSKYVTVNTVYDEEFGCDIINISNQKDMIHQLNSQQKIMAMVIIIAILVLIIMIMALTKNMMGSIHNMVGIMKLAGEGDMGARAENNDNTPTELKTIEMQFNKMLDKLQEAMKKEKIAGEKQRNAEIAALEAQINPHFLYNTLDTINWMAIDKDEYEISNSITSLAHILRYGIDDSNGIVTVSRECEWLKQYLFLQQTRLKDTFECEVSVAPEVMEWRIHKLLIQPFVENSILHGFREKTGNKVLKIKLEPHDDMLQISVWDNGIGIASEVVDNFNSGIFKISREKSCLGVENAVTRIQMYYGDRAQFRFESEKDKYTLIILKTPKLSSSQGG